MRNLREMLGNEEKVWVYLESSAEWERFAAMAAEEGFSFGELPAEKWVPGHAVAVHRDGSMGHLAMFIWVMSFAGAESGPEKIDFRRFIEGAGDCSCNSSHFRMRLLSGCR